MALARSAPASTQAVESGGSLSSISRFAISLHSRAHPEQRASRRVRQLGADGGSAAARETATTFDRLRAPSPPLLDFTQHPRPRDLTRTCTPAETRREAGTGCFRIGLQGAPPGTCSGGGPELDRLGHADPLSLFLYMRKRRRSTVRLMLGTG